METLRRWWQQPLYIKLPIIMLVLMSIQLTPVEGYQISFIKVALMCAAIAYYFFNATINKAVMMGGLFWLVCCIASLFHEQMRWSTMLYFGMYIGSYFAFYQCVGQGAFSLQSFQKLLKGLLFAFCIVLVLQQICIILGIYHFPILNLNSSHRLSLGLKTYYEWNRLPVLTCEPSHSATIVTGLMLGWLRTLEMEYGVRKVGIKELFNQQNRLVTLAYIYLIVFMGSGTGWIGFAILLLYFVRLKTLYYVVPGIVLIMTIGLASGNEQFKRAWTAAKATMTLDQKTIIHADVSGATRIVPFVNTLKADLKDRETWVGNGTIMENLTIKNWTKTFDMKITTVDQYGLIGFIAALIFVYTCMIKRVFSMETLCFIALLRCDIGNIYLIWSMLFVFTVIRYLQEHPDEYDIEELDDKCLECETPNDEI